VVLANSEFAVMSIHASRTNGRNRSTVAAVHNERGKRVMESILETESETIQSFLKGLTGRVHVTFEEGTHAAWLYGVTTRSSAEIRSGERASPEEDEERSHARLEHEL